MTLTCVGVLQRLVVGNFCPTKGLKDYKTRMNGAVLGDFNGTNEDL